MATLYITEFANLGLLTNGIAPVAQMPPVAEQVVTITTESDSAALNANTRFVRLCSDSVCSVAVGTTAANATASTSKMRIPADSPEYFAVLPGSFISVISNS